MRSRYWRLVEAAVYCVWPRLKRPGSDKPPKEFR